MVAMRSPMPVIPGVSRARVIVRIRLGISVVRSLAVPVWIIIVARRIGITVPGKSKTESPNPWKSRGDLSVSTLPGNEGQSAYCQSNQEKFLHRFTSSVSFRFCLLFCAGRLRVFLYRGIRMRSASRLPRRIKNAVGFRNSGFQSATGRIRRGEPDRSSRLPSLPIHEQAGCPFRRDRQDACITRDATSNIYPRNPGNCKTQPDRREPRSKHLPEAVDSRSEKATGLLSS